MCEGGDLHYWLGRKRQEYDDMQVRRKNLKVKLEKQSKSHKRGSTQIEEDLKTKIMDLTDEKEGFSKDRTTFYTAEVLLGLSAIHEAGWIYRDLKPANILLSLDGHVVISDLGMCRKYDPAYRVTGTAGTPGYWAPETLAGVDTNFASDVWTLGVLVYVLIEGMIPRCRCDRDEGEWCPFERKDRDLDRSKPATLSKIRYSASFWPAAVDLCKAILVHDASARPTLADLKQHEFFQDINWKLLAARAVDPPFLPEQQAVHTESMADIGQFEDEEETVEVSDMWAEFEYSNVAVLEEEYTHCLKLMAKRAAKLGDTPPAPANCCVLQ
jgi:serine/threonine protein kinase